MYTVVNLSKILEGNPNFAEQNVVKTDKCMDVSRFGGGRVRAAPKVYAYEYVLIK